MFTGTTLRVSGDELVNMPSIAKLSILGGASVTAIRNQLLFTIALDEIALVFGMYAFEISARRNKIERDPTVPHQLWLNIFYLSAVLLKMEL